MKSPRNISSKTLKCDVAILGGGLAGGLIALALRRKRPELDVLLIEESATLGGNHIWSFFGPDVAGEHRWLVAPLVCHGWRGYDGLVDIGLEKHFRVNHGNNEFVRGSNHVNGIESFWSYAKHRLAQFHGIRKDKFELHLKETEFRFNHRHLDLYKTLLRLLRDQPL